MSDKATDKMIIYPEYKKMKYLIRSLKYKHEIETIGLTKVNKYKMFTAINARRYVNFSSLYLKNADLDSREIVLKI